jgi:hypothetical protein
MPGLTDSQQSYFMLLAFILVPVGAWAGLGFPTDKTALGLLASNIITGIVMFVKERLGVPVPQIPQPKPS